MVGSGEAATAGGVTTAVGIYELRSIETASKTYPDLDAEIIGSDRCTYCLGCLEFCRRENREAILFVDETLRYVEDDCTRCGMCYAICPEFSERDEDLDVRYESAESDLGRYEGVTSAVTRDRDVKAVCLDGGVVSSLLLYMLDNGIVDGAVVSSGDSPWSHEPSIATTKEEILAAAGFRFDRAGHLAGMKELITNFQIMTFLRRWHRENPDSKMRLAAVGTGCQIYSIRKMQYTHVAPSEKVALTIGLLCYGNVAMSGGKEARFEEALGASLGDIEKLNMKDDLIVTLKDGNVRHVPLERFSYLINPNCLRCTDYTCRFADISVGGLGSEDGFNTVIVRTEKGMDVFEGALKAGYITEWDDIFTRGEGKAETESRLIDTLFGKLSQKQGLSRARGRKKAP